MKPRIIKGVWVGKLNDGRFIVFDPKISNLYVTAENQFFPQKVSLWCYKGKLREYFDIESVKVELESNINKISEFDRQKVANAYFSWKLKSLGCKNKYEYISTLEEIKDNLKEIAEEDEDWYARLSGINLGYSANE